MPCHPDRVRRNYEEEDYRWKEWPPKGTKLRDVCDQASTQLQVEIEKLWKGDKNK